MHPPMHSQESCFKGMKYRSIWRGGQHTPMATSFRLVCSWCADGLLTFFEDCSHAAAGTERQKRQAKNTYNVLWACDASTRHKGVKP